jgi:hypothetical protein
VTGAYGAGHPASLRTTTAPEGQISPRVSDFVYQTVHAIARELAGWCWSLATMQ